MIKRLTLLLGTALFGLVGTASARTEAIWFSCELLKNPAKEHLWIWMVRDDRLYIFDEESSELSDFCVPKYPVESIVCTATPEAFTRQHEFFERSARRTHYDNISINRLTGRMTRITKQNMEGYGITEQDPIEWTCTSIPDPRPKAKF